MSTFLTTEGLSIPWCESPLAFDIIDSVIEDKKIQAASYGISEKDLETHIHNFLCEGYIVFNSGFSSEFLSNTINQLDEALEKTKVEVQAGHYHYSDGPRIFKAWDWCKPVWDIAVNGKAMFLLEVLYGRPAIPFQTINFKIGSNQPVHSDAVHFNTIPERWVAGYWTALEDVTENNGPLRIYPGSQDLPIYDFQDLNMKATAYNEEKENYTKYEEFINLVKENYFEKVVLMEAGESVIWRANLLHGGSDIIDPSLTRWSQATHCYFPGCTQYYTPFYSSKYEGIYSDKKIENKDIRGKKW